MPLSEQIIAELCALVERVADGQPTPTKKFVFEMLFGLVASGSVLLTQVGRKLPPTGTLHAVEKRLSRQLGSRRWDESSLTEQYVAWVAPQKVIGYAIRKGIAALWAAGLLKRPSFGFG